MSNHFHIPSEIIIPILVRLPVQSLLRFTPVCKLWYSIITNPKFITTHLNRFRESSTVQLLVSFYIGKDSERKCQVITEDDKIHTELAFPSRSESSGRHIYVVGTCNGLICLSDGYEECAKHLIIWNPIIRKSVTLTLPEKHRIPYTSVTGFGFVLGKNDYKVVRIIGGHWFNQAEVYEQGGEWRVTGCAPPLLSEGITYSSSPMFLHGALHWLAYVMTSMTNRSIIVFDMGDEVFREIVLPPNLQLHSIYSLITLFDGSLAVIYDGKWSTGSVALWVMRDYGVFGSWNKMYNIIMPSSLHKPLAFRKSGEILLQSYEDAIVLYDPETQSYTSTGIQNDSLVSKVHTFIESLILLEGEKAVTDRFAHLF